MSFAPNIIIYANHDETKSGFALSNAEKCKNKQDKQRCIDERIIYF